MSSTGAPTSSTTDPTRASGPSTSRAMRAPGILLGLGLGGFVDGILLHQILQWHHMLSSTDSDHVGVADYPVDTLAGLEMNTVWDGLFHVFSWVMVVIGLAVLHARTRHTGLGAATRGLWSWVVVGWGLFNVTEGLVNHHLLAVHHVRSGSHELAYDLGFLAFGVLLIVGGWVSQRRA